MGPYFIYSLTGLLCVAGLLRPHVGLIGYFGFAILCPQWYWRFTLPDLPYQRYIAIATIAGAVLSGFRGNRFQLSGAATAAVGGLVFFYFWCLASSVQSVSPDDTQFFMRIIWKIVLMSVMGVLLLDTPQKILALMWVAVFAQGYNAFRIHEMYFEMGFIRVYDFTWNFLDNNTYSISTIPIMAMTVALVLGSPKLWQKMLAFLFFVLEVNQIMLLESRGCMLAAVALGAVLVVFMPKNVWTLTSLILCLALVVRLAGPRVIEEFNSAFAAQHELDSSAESRFRLWKAGAAITQRYPIFGAGPWAGQALVPQFYDGVLHYNKRALHNLFFEISTGCGIPGLAGFLLFFWGTWFAHLRLVSKGWRNLPPWVQSTSMATLAGIPAFWVASMFSSGALIESPYTLVVIGAATLLVYQRERQAALARYVQLWNAAALQMGARTPQPHPRG